MPVRAPPLVLIHGIGSRWQVWQPVLDGLVANRDVIALDLPGFGASPMPPAGTPAGMESLTSLVIGFLDQLELAQPHVAGNSLGGWIALELAKRGRAQTATALSPAGFWRTGVEARYSRGVLWTTFYAARLGLRHADRLLATRLGRKLAFGLLNAHAEQISASDAVQSLRAFAGAPWFAQTLIALRGERFHNDEHLAPPVTIAWGDRDRLLWPGQAARAVQLLPSARLVTLYGCGHVPTYDDPGQVTRVMLEGSSPG